MLFKKTLKVALATALWMVALLGANSAMAQDLPTYSAETLTGNGPAYDLEFNHVGDDEADPPIPDPELTTTIDINSRAAYYLGLVTAGTADTYVHIRVSTTGVLGLSGAPKVELGSVSARGALETAAVHAAKTTNWVEVENPDAVALGAGYRYAVMAAGADLEFRGIRVGVLDDAADPDMSVTGVGNGGVMVSVYADQADAHFGEGAPYLSDSSDLLSVKQSVAAVAAPENPVGNEATAATRFTAIDGFEEATGPYEISVGGFQVTVNGAHLNAESGLPLGTDAAANYKATGVSGGTRFYGDGGWGFASGFRFSQTHDCAGASPNGGRSRTPRWGRSRDRVQPGQRGRRDCRRDGWNRASAVVPLRHDQQRQRGRNSCGFVHGGCQPDAGG